MDDRRILRRRDGKIIGNLIDTLDEHRVGSGNPEPGELIVVLECIGNARRGDRLIEITIGLE